MQRRQWLVMAAACVLAGCSAGQPRHAAHETEGWTTSYAEALKQAAAENKPVLALFTGSDWCPPCMAMERTVLSSDRFRDWAKDRVVLLLVDFPQSKDQDAAIKMQNEKLGEKYQAEGFPSVLLLRPSGEEISRITGYSGAGVDAWIAQVEGILAPG